jgi:hypothetical protein
MWCGMMFLEETGSFVQYAQMSGRFVLVQNDVYKAGEYIRGKHRHPDYG